MTSDASAGRFEPARPGETTPSCSESESPPAGGSAALWDQMLEQARTSLSEQSFATWLTSVRPISWAQKTLRLEAQSEFHAEWLEDRYGELLHDIAAAITGTEVELQFVFRESGPNRTPPEIAVTPVSPQGAALARAAEPAGAGYAVRPGSGPRRQPPTPAGSPRAPAQPPAPALASHIDRRYTFERFVVGGNNALSRAACKAVSERPASNYNPLFLYGATGMGKTHLLHAIGNRARDLGVGERIGYIRAEQFLNDMVAAMAHNANEAFRARYRSYDLLLVDDIQFMRGKERTQEEFFHTFNVLYQKGHQIVLTSDRHPKELDGLEGRLVSRFEWGLVTEIDLPDYETRVAILRKKTEEFGIHPSLDVLDFVARRCTSSVRELEGAIMKLVALADVTRQEVNLALARAALIGTAGLGSPLGPDAIVERVAKEWGLRGRDLASRRRTHDIVRPRQVAMFLLRTVLELSLNQVGRILGGYDHSTVSYSMGVVEARMKADPDFRNRVQGLRDKFEPPS